jgi:hypothetical protein
MKHPATELNGFLERMAVWLRDNKPDFVTNYNVTMTTYEKRPGCNVIRMTTNFEMDNAEIVAIEAAKLVDSET